MAELQRQVEKHMDRLISGIGVPKAHAFSQRKAEKFFLEVHRTLTNGVTQRRGILYYVHPSADFSESARQDFVWNQGELFVREFVFDGPVAAVRLISKAADASYTNWASGRTGVQWMRAVWKFRAGQEGRKLIFFWIMTRSL